MACGGSDSLTDNVRMPPPAARVSLNRPVHAKTTGGKKTSKKEPTATVIPPFFFTPTFFSFLLDWGSVSKRSSCTPSTQCSRLGTGWKALLPAVFAHGKTNQTASHGTTSSLHLRFLQRLAPYVVQQRSFFSACCATNSFLLLPKTLNTFSSLIPTDQRFSSSMRARNNGFFPTIHLFYTFGGSKFNVLCSMKEKPN
jgi:hypothetical protein